MTTPRFHSTAARRPARGFTLVELMITVAIVAIGMLGLAKLQAAGMAEASLSRTRAIVTMQGESLASVMRTNRAYWGATSATSAPSVTVNAGGTWADNSGTMGSDPGTLCNTGTCNAAQMAYYDMKTWVQYFSAQFPTGTTQVVCTLGSSSAPNTCDITLSWIEHYVAINRNSGDAGAQKTAPAYMVLHVQP